EVCLLSFWWRQQDVHRGGLCLDGRRIGARYHRFTLSSRITGRFFNGNQSPVHIEDKGFCIDESIEKRKKRMGTNSFNIKRKGEMKKLVYTSAYPNFNKMIKNILLFCLGF